MELDGQARSLFNSTQYFSCAYILEDTRSFESHVGLRWIKQITRVVGGGMGGGGALLYHLPGNTSLVLSNSHAADGET